MSLKWFDTPADLLANGAAQSGMNLFPVYEGPFPWVTDAMNDDGTPGPRQDVKLVNARITKVVVGDDEYAVVLLCAMEAGVPRWTIYCGDKQVEGSFSEDGKTLANALRLEGKVSDKLANLLESSEWVAKVPVMAQCNFFKRMARTGKFCSHTQEVLSTLSAPDLTQMADDLKDWLDGKAIAEPEAPPVPLSPEEEAFYDAAFIQHVLLVGERGSGKTYLARQAADRYGAVYLELQMHPSMEAWEMRAHDRACNGKVYTVLGKLAEAVYWIQQGKKVVLCMDELLNMNPMYTTVINSPLTLTSRDTYLIETGRIIDLGDGIGQVETVEVPADMLWVVATSNIGARYNTEISPSVRARFLVILMNTNPDRTEKIVESILSEYGMPKDFAKKFRDFIEACKQAVDENKLNEEATTRLAANVLRSVYKRAQRDKKSPKNVAGWKHAIKKQLLVEIAQVVNFEQGPLDPGQEELYKALVNTYFD